MDSGLRSGMRGISGPLGVETAMETIEELHPHGGDWLREIVFGLNDGLVTTLVFVVAVSAVTSGQLVRVALGELLAGGVSMGLGGYLAARTEREVLERRIATERQEIAQEPGEERTELRNIYRDKGLSGPLLDDVVTHLTADRERWLRALVQDELGVVGEDLARPWLQGALIAASFMVGALVPIIPFMASLSRPQVWAYGATAVVALILGAVKARYTCHGPARSGLELLALVTAGTVAGVAIGAVLGAV